VTPRTAILVCAAFLAACRTPAPATQSHVVNLSISGLALGDERVETVIRGQRAESRIRTRLSRGSGVELDGRLVLERGRAVSLQVNGNAPAFLPSTIDVTVTPDRTDTFPVRSPLPLHVLATLARQSIVGGRRLYRALPEGTVDVAPCRDTPRPYRDATCHEVSGLTWGAVHVWLDRRQALAAAVVPTGWGLLLATTPERDDSHAALLAHYATARAGVLGAAAPAEAPGHSPIAFRNVRLLDGSGPVLERATVVIAGDRIAAAGPPDRVRVPGGARVIEGDGLTLFPGLWDMHAHLKQPEWAPAYLASGVTTVRDLGSDAAFVTTLRSLAENRALPAPDMLLAGFIDADAAAPHTATQANSPEQARALVRRFEEAGFDGLKTWNHVSAAVLPHVTDEAHRRGLTVTGHVPSGMTAIEAIDAGLDGINHIDALLEAADGDLDSRRGQALLAKLLARRVVVDPTLVVLEYANRSRDTPVSAFEPGILKAPAAVARLWSALGQPPGRATAEPLHRAMRLVRGLHAAGVPIVAGSDQGVPGYTLHRELELYVEAGLTPLEALATATSVPARVSGRRDVGPLAAGQRANVVLVRGRPDRAIAATRNVVLVVAGGVLYDPAPLWRAAGFEP
jgi:imidazolonepropionase-like amidohydrolase